MLRVPVLSQKETPNESEYPGKLLISLIFSWLASSAGSQSKKGFTGLSPLYIHHSHRQFDSEIFNLCRLQTLEH